MAGPAQGGNGTFAYDPLDNLRVLDQGSRQFRYHYDANNRLEQIKSPTGALLHSFGYDARGNTTSKDSGTLTFDRENRLTHSALPTATSYVYDGLGRRVREFMGASTYFYYSHEGKLLYTNDHKTSTRTDHIYLSGSLVAARKVQFGSNPSITVTYQHTDALGSPVAFTDASGTVTRRERMTAWGEPADGTWSNEPGYTGHQMDAASKLVYMQQRYYDPAVGRFLSADPLPVDAKTGVGFNRAWYANNNPFSNIDPDGRDAIHLWDKGQVVFPVYFEGPMNTPEMRSAIEKKVASLQSDLPEVSSFRIVYADSPGVGINTVHLGDSFNPNCGAAGECTNAPGGNQIHINCASGDCPGKVAHDLLHAGGMRSEGYLDSGRNGDRVHDGYKAGYGPDDIGANPGGNKVKRKEAQEILESHSTREMSSREFQGYFRVNGRLDSKRLAEEL